MLKISIIAGSVLLLLQATGRFHERNALPAIALCRDIPFHAHQLRTQDPNELLFGFTIKNQTSAKIGLMPGIPNGSILYALKGGRWRRSVTAGTSILPSAAEDSGLLYVMRQPNSEHESVIAIKPGKTYTWERVINDIAGDSGTWRDPPGTKYRVVFTYGYLPTPEDDNPMLLTCGLRSNSVDLIEGP